MSSRNKGAIRERRRKEGREIAARTPGISRHSCSRRERSFRLFTISVTFTFFNILFPNVPPPNSRSASYPPFKACVSPQYCWVEGAWSGQFEPFSLVPCSSGVVVWGLGGYRLQTPRCLRKSLFQKSGSSSCPDCIHDCSFLDPA